MGSSLVFVSGSTRIDLNERTGLFLQAGYYPAVDVRAKTVTESVKVQLRGPISANIQQLDRWFEIARSNDPTMEKIYLEYKVAEGATVWRSRIYDGAVVVSSAISREYHQGRVNVEISFERDSFWEGAETQIPLTNENGTNNTTGLTIYNTNDGVGVAPDVRVNYVGISGANVLGSIPAPPRIEITNTYSSGTARLSDVWIGRSIDDTTNPFQWFIPHEVTTNTTASTEQQISLTELDTNFLKGTKGGHYRIFSKMHYGYQDLRLNVALYFPASVALTPMQKAPEVVQNYGHVVDLGTLQIPPWLPGISDQAPVGLRLGGRRAGGFNQTFFDFFLFPANAFRQLIPRGYGIATDVTLVDDGITETVWTDGWTGGGKTGHYSGYGDWITLVPGKNQKLLFLTKTMTGGYEDEISASIKVFYRPRELMPL